MLFIVITFIFMEIFVNAKSAFDNAIDALLTQTIKEASIKRIALIS